MRPSVIVAISLAGLPTHSLCAETSIYRCELDGVVTFADRPCSPQAAPHQPDAARVSVYEAPPQSAVPRPGRARPKRAGARASTAADQAKRAEECDRIQTSLREIRSTMRSGYTAAEGERLNARYAKLQSDRREQRCR